MKFITILILFTYTISSHAEQWFCSIQEKPDTQAVFDSASESLWLQTPTEKIDLITPQRISSWQMPREKCEIQTNYDHGDKYDLYSVNYRCSFKVGGSFQFDFKALEGFYREDLYQGGNRNMYNLNNCQRN